MPAKLTSQADVDEYIETLSIKELKEIAQRSLMRRVRIAETMREKKRMPHTPESKQKTSESVRAYWAKQRSSYKDVLS